MSLFGAWLAARILYAESPEAAYSVATMMQEEVEVALETFRRFQPGDDSWVELWDLEATMSGPEGWPEPGPFVGREAIVRQFERLRADWSDWSFEDVVPKSDLDGWIIVSFRWRTRGAASEIEADFPMAVAYRLKDGGITVGHFRWTVEQALRAARDPMMS